VWTYGLDESTATDAIQDLAAYRKPISVLDTLGGSRLEDAANYYARVRLYKLWGDTRAGMMVGNYLRGMGHVAIAFVTPFSDLVWSEARLAGLRRAYKNARGAGVAFVGGSYDVSSIDGRSWTIEELKGVRDRIVERGVSTAHPLERHMGLALRNLIEEINARMKQESFARAMRELLSSCAPLEQASAWIAVNDDVALQCLLFAKSKGIKVPRDVSLIGFDDSLPAQVNGITSYNFNETAAIQATINHVIEHVSAPTCEKVVDIRGSIVERTSVLPHT
jgi:DNA-binding LacI/PurR family transcriptional regulator